MRAETISNPDGTQIALRDFEPERCEQGNGVVGGAMGVRQDCYAPFPVLALSITDDELMTLRGTHSRIDLYENAEREVQSLAPADVGVRRLGHFGPFRSEHAARLWPGLAQRLAGFARGIHVAHVVIDGAIDTAFIRDNFPQRYALKDQDGILNPDHIADACWMLHSQPRDAWTHELDLRPYREKF